MTAPIRLISFLGTGTYKPVRYRYPDNGGIDLPESPFIAHAAALHLKNQGLDDVAVVATDLAWQTHGETLLARFSQDSLPQPRRVEFPTGANPQELWQQFQILLGLLRGDPGRSVVLDITHGFRSQPFFAAGAVNFIKLIDPSPLPVRVIYGAFDQKDSHGLAPIWDLTPFVELCAWSAQLMLLLKTGRSQGAAAETEALGKQLNARWAAAGRVGPKPALTNFANALHDFGADLETIRVRDLFLGSDGKGGSASRLHQAIAASRKDIATFIPPLADVLDQIDTLASSLVLPTPTLEGDAGTDHLLKLAQTYQTMGRYSEAAVILREASVSRHAAPDAVNPGLPGFAAISREAAEAGWRENDPNQRTFSDLRNDIEHAGYRRRPKPAHTIKQMIQTLLDALRNRFRI